MLDLRREGDVHILRLDDGENRLTPPFLHAVCAALDELTAAPAPGALVTTGTGKFYSNGLDLDWVLRHPHERDGYLDRVHGLFVRLLTLPMPTVAALNGHAFAAGAMLSLPQDYRVMRA